MTRTFICLTRSFEESAPHYSINSVHCACMFTLGQNYYRFHSNNNLTNCILTLPLSESIKAIFRSSFCFHRVVNFSSSFTFQLSKEFLKDWSKRLSERRLPRRNRQIPNGLDILRDYNGTAVGTICIPCNFSDLPDSRAFLLHCSFCIYQCTIYCT